MGESYTVSCSDPTHVTQHFDTLDIGAHQQSNLSSHIHILSHLNYRRHQGSFTIGMFCHKKRSFPSQHVLTSQGPPITRGVPSWGSHLVTCATSAYFVHLKGNLPITPRSIVSAHPLALAIPRGLNRGITRHQTGREGREDLCR